MLQRFVYYKLPRESLSARCAAVRAAQRGWSSRHPGLAAELLWRVDEGPAGGPGPVTVMEVWRWAPPCTDAKGGTEGREPDWPALERELGALLAGAALGGRHVEVFAPVPG